MTKKSELPPEDTVTIPRKVYASLLRHRKFFGYLLYLGMTRLEIYDEAAKMDREDRATNKRK